LACRGRLILFTVFLDLLGIGLIFPIGPFYAGAVIALAPSPRVLYVVSAPLPAGGCSLWRSALNSLITKLVSPREQGWPTAARRRQTVMWAGATFEQLGTASPFLAGAAMFGLAGVTIATAVRR
jgi:hypothetical protein